jgi:holo-[acyl-carrier protein] synthase
MILRTGIDIIEIARLDLIQPAIKARFLKRVFTPTELEQVGGSTPSLAGRFAAKEAVSKALGCGIGPVRWQDIEIQRGPGGEPMLRLYGQAQRIAQQLGLNTWSLSISHSQTHAIAMAVGLGSEDKQ